MKYFGDLPWYLNVDNDNVIMTRLWKATLTIKLTIIVNRHKCVNTSYDCQWGLDNENSVIMVIKQGGIKNKREIFSLVIFDALDLYQITQMVSFTYLLVVLLLIVLFAVSSQILGFFSCVTALTGNPVRLGLKMPQRLMCSRYVHEDKWLFFSKMSMTVKHAPSSFLSVAQSSFKSLIPQDSDACESCQELRGTKPDSWAAICFLHPSRSLSLSSAFLHTLQAVVLYVPHKDTLSEQ